MQSSTLRYPAAIGAVLVSLVVTQYFVTLYSQGILFIMLGAVMLATWFGGRGPGFLATGLSTVGSLYFVIPPVFSFQMSGPEDVIRLCFFMAVSLLIVLLTDAQQRTNALLLANKERLEHEVLKRREAEDGLRNYGYTLERRVADRTRELETANQRLQGEITERFKVEQNLKRYATQKDVLCRISSDISSVLELPHIMTTLVQSAMQLTDAEAGFHGVLHDDQVVLTEYYREGDMLPINYTFQKGYGVPGHVLETGKPYVCNDAEHDPRVVTELQRQYGFHNLVNVPIVSRQKHFLGCFQVFNKRGHRPFDEVDVQVLEALAASAAVAIENASMVSGQKEMEEALRRANERLEGQVRERTNELTKLNAALQEKIKDLEMFHDLVIGRELKMIELENEIERLRALESPPAHAMDRRPSEVLN